MGLCEEDRIILMKNLYEFKCYGVNRLMKVFSKKNDGRRVRLFRTIFWNSRKNNVRMLGSAVAEDRELLVQQQTSATSSQRPYSETGRRSLDASNIATDCQKNKCPSFISPRYISRRLTSSSVRKNDARRSYPKPKQIVSTVCYKINLS